MYHFEVMSCIYTNVRHAEVSILLHEQVQRGVDGHSVCFTAVHVLRILFDQFVKPLTDVSEEVQKLLRRSTVA